MHVLTQNISSYSNAVSSWQLAALSAADVTATIPFPSGRHKVFKITCTSANNALSYEGVVKGVSNAIRLTFGAWLWTDSGQPFSVTQYIDNFNASSYQQWTQVQSINNVPKLYTVSTSDFAFVVNTFVTALQPVSSVGNYFYVAMPHAFYSDGYLEVHPEWDIKLQHAKIQNQHKARSGKTYTYRWGEIEGARFGLTYVSTIARAVINNSYWRNDARVIFGTEDGATLIEGHLINKTSPIEGYQKPYTTMYKGTIELESF